MNLTLLRFSGQDDSTLGVLLQEGRFLCFTLEDEARDVKVPGETCIPVGRYRVTLRSVGGFHGRYGARFGRMHRGMLWLRDVPDFQYILIHCGNTDDDTAGCILVGDSANQNVTLRGFIGQSVNAYERIYPPIADAIEEGEDVWIDVRDAREEYGPPCWETAA